MDKSANARNNEKIAINSYCGNGENRNFREIDAWYQDFQREKPISIEAYEILMKTLFETREKRDIFAHLFLVLDWCPMKRAENCVNAKINHVHLKVTASSLSSQSLRDIKMEKII